ncbi:ABC-2 family transporter protein [Bacillus wiedmannii]|uniref:ABC-2 family transporter protein n=1 Tax=Bacillus wiedmannii TaxID=1890302 RepID=UPI0015CF495A|nr:ABC-2 family transporter protein [Bacillus wiedmannii]
MFKKHLEIFFALKIAYLKGRFSYTFNFYLELIGAFASICVWLLGMKFALEKFGSLAGWEFKDILLMVSLFYMSWTIASMFCLHITNIVFEVRDGSFIKYLIRPFSPLFMYISSSFPISTLGSALSSIIMFFWAIKINNIHFNLLDIIFIIYSIIGGAFIIAGTFILNSGLAFKNIDTTNTFENSLGVAREMSRFPLKIYPWYLKWILLTIIPYGLVAYVPIHFIMHKPLLDLPPVLIIISPIIGVIYFILCWRIWGYFLKQYDATGS